MGLSILNNIPSLEAENQLGITNTNLQNTLFQLSSGSKINSGADDPAGLSIADGLQANISALTQSGQNISEGVGMLQTADGALSQVTTLLNRAVTLATEAGNAGLTQGADSQQAALQTEYESITNQINQIGANTTFNDTQVFTANPVTVFLSDGSGIDANNQGTANSNSISVTMQSLSASALNLGTYASGTLDLENQPTSGNTVQIGSQTYTFVGSGSASYINSVAIGGTVGATLSHLMEAVNNGPNGAGAGSDYGANTTANTSATITSVNGGSATLQAVNAGTDGNEITLSSLLTTSGGSSSANLNGGTVAVSATGVLQLGSAQPNVLTQATGALTLNSNISAGTTATGTISLLANPSAGTNASGTFTLSGLPANGDELALGSNTYTFVTSGSATSEGDVAIDSGNSVSQTLTNLMNAITQTSGGSDSTYDPLPTTGVTAALSAAGNSLVITSTTAGTAGNNAISMSAPVNTSGAESVTGTSGGDLSGGTAADTITVGTTAYTFVGATSATTGNEVAIGNSLNATLLNLMGAVNNAGSGGGSYHSVAANTLATISVPTNSNVATVSAIASGTFGNNSVTLSDTFAGGASTGSLGNLSGGKLSGGTAGDTVNVGGTTYTFVASGQATQGTEVAIGGSAYQTLENLEGAVNNGGTGALGSYYTNGGVAQANGTATISVATDSNVANVTAVAIGALGNTSVALSGNFAGGTSTAAFSGLASGKLSGGTNADTFVLGPAGTATTYTFVAAGSATTGNEVALGGTVQETLQYLAAAITTGGSDSGDGNYYTNGGTAAANPVLATTGGAVVNGNTLTLTANGANSTYAGANGNSVVFSATGSLASDIVGGASTLTNGAAATAAKGSLTFSNLPSAGDTVNVAGTSYTFVASGNATAANEVAIATSGENTAANIATTLGNLVAAINTTGGTDSGAALLNGTTFGIGTGVNTAASATVSSPGVVTVTATLSSDTPNNVGNGLALSANLSNGAGGAVGSGTLSGGTVAASLGTAAEAQTALNSITSAISQVASMRGTIGSGINQMNAALQVMNNTSQNLTSSLSSVQDANIGTVISNMSKYQVLEQTGIAALAQSNTSEQAVLKLLP
jgi:flagellin